jgi:hypothetical protein
MYTSTYECRKRWNIQEKLKSKDNYLRSVAGSSEKDGRYKK